MIYYLIAGMFTGIIAAVTETSLLSTTDRPLPISLLAVLLSVALWPLIWVVAIVRASRSA